MVLRLWSSLSCGRLYIAIMICSWQEFYRVVLKFDGDILEIARFIGEVHSVLKDRPIYYPDYIGGHCLIPNTKLLGDSFPSKLFDFVIESNDRRAAEVRDERVRRDIEALRGIMLEYTDSEYYRV